MSKEKIFPHFFDFLECLFFNEKLHKIQFYFDEKKTYFLNHKVSFN